MLCMSYTPLHMISCPPSLAACLYASGRQEGIHVNSTLASGGQLPLSSCVTSIPGWLSCCSLIDQVIYLTWTILHSFWGLASFHVQCFILPIEMLWYCISWNQLVTEQWLFMQRLTTVLQLLNYWPRTH